MSPHKILEPVKLINTTPLVRLKSFTRPSGRVFCVRSLRGAKLDAIVAAVSPLAMPQAVQVSLAFRLIVILESTAVVTDFMIELMPELAVILGKDPRTMCWTVDDDLTESGQGNEPHLVGEVKYYLF